MSKRDALKRPLRTMLGIALVATLAWAGTRVPLLLAQVQMFDVTETSVDGAGVLTHAEVLAIAEIPGGASVWDDFTPWIDRLEEHPLLDEATIDRELPGTLHIRVVEREAVALVAMPTLEPVDRDGRRLPIDPSRVPLDLPVIRLPEDPAQEGRPPSAVRIRPLARAADRMRSEVSFWTGVSELSLDENNGIRALWAGDVVVSIPQDIDPYRLRDAVSVIRHAIEDPERTPRNVDLRFADQIIVRYTEPRGT